MAEINHSWQAGEQDYRAYLLRCWQEEDIQHGREPEGSPVWRFTLVQIDNERRTKGFACKEKLLNYLREEFG
ncbi:MAG: hypothetical protein WA996_09545 [Candidatus Promineifilaceae bacterium]